MDPATSQKDSAKHSPASLLSNKLFYWGLALITFEQVRPLAGIQVSDYCFFASSFLVLSSRRERLRNVEHSGVLYASLFILAGAAVSTLNAGGIADSAGVMIRLVTLFGLFAMLTLAHSTDLRKAMLYLIGGVSANCFVALIQAWIFPDIVSWLSINPTREDLSHSGRLQALTSHPNVLGLSAALALLLAIGLLSFESNRVTRRRLLLSAAVCTMGALSTGSRTFIACLVPSLMFFGLLRGIRLRTYLRFALIVIVAYIVIDYATPTVISAYSGRVEASGEENIPDYARWMTAGLALLQISAKPLLGWGVNHIGEAGMMLIPGTWEISGSHNTFLQYWYGAGALGGLGFLLCFALPVRQVLRAIRRIDEAHCRALLHLSLACLALLFIASNLHGILYNRFLYVPIFLCAGFAARTIHIGNSRPVLTT